MTDTAQLLQQLARPTQRDAAWAALHERFTPCLRRLGREAGLPPQALDDLVQDSLLAIEQAAPRFRAGAHGEASARAWLLTIARRQLGQRRRGRESRALARLGAEPQAPSARPDQVLERAQQRAQLGQRLDALPEQLRTPLQLRYLSGMGYPELAEQLGISISNARVRVHRGLGRLRRSWQGFVLFLLGRDRATRQRRLRLGGLALLGLLLWRPLPSPIALAQAQVEEPAPGDEAMRFTLELKDASLPFLAEMLGRVHDRPVRLSPALQAADVTLSLDVQQATVLEIIEIITSNGLVHETRDDCEWIDLASMTTS